LFRAGALPAAYQPGSIVAAYLKTLMVLPGSAHPFLQGILFLGLIAVFFQ